MTVPDRFAGLRLYEPPCGDEPMRSVNSGSFGGGAAQTIVIPVYVGREKVDELVVDAFDRKYRRRHKVGAA